MPDQQMRSALLYPVDRYLVESSNKIEMVNIIDDEELWAPAPALRPEDEVMLRRLHDMLQSTAGDLKLLSGELAAARRPGVQLRTQPLPLDEEFNEKVHIEELVNAKFHGYKIIDKSSLSKLKSANEVKPGNINVGAKTDRMDSNKTAFKNLSTTRTRILEIEEKIDKNKTEQKLNNGAVLNAAPKPAVSYNEFTYKYVEPKVKLPQQRFKIQDMPSINIRSELIEQKVLQLDIFPVSKEKPEDTVSRSNVAVVAVEHEITVPKSDPKITLVKEQEFSSHSLPVRNIPQSYLTKQPIRKISKMSTCESSESANVSSDTLHNLKTQKQIKSVIKSSPKTSARDRIKVKKTNIKEPEKRTRLNIEQWKNKLNVVYGHQPSSLKNSKTVTKSTKKYSPKKPNQPSTSKPTKSVLNNSEYIPYSQLTLGGVRVSDIEKELSDISNMNDAPLSPILDKILSSRENSFHKNPKRNKKKESPRVFTTSDENLLQEVIDIESRVSKTIESESIESNAKKVKEEPKAEELKPDSNASISDKDSYPDDFEDEKSENTGKSEDNDDSNPTHSGKDREKSSDEDAHEDFQSEHEEVQPNEHNRTYVKKSNLSIKNSIDVFEFIHLVETQDTSTQSNTTRKLKETQTSPRHDKPNIQPIRNDLWPMDPKGEVEKMFKLEKEFIKKLIIDEYGEFLEKNITKPSTSRAAADEMARNVTASQKLTQTSPAHVKSVMTSPTKTKTRTTSPFVSVKVDHQTSPMIVVTNEEHLSVEMEDDEEGISINLSSPRFNLRLPQTSREVLSNLEEASIPPSGKQEKIDNLAKSKGLKTYRKDIVSSSSSEVENSSEISSLGEVTMKLKRRLRKKDKVPSISEFSDSSSSRCSSEVLTGSILPLRSEGEVSVGQLMKKVSNKARKFSTSEGEVSARKNI